MFKKITIHLDGHFCNCPYPKYSWNHDSTDQSKSLQITCDLCRATMLVPHRLFLGEIEVSPSNDSEINRPLFGSAKLFDQSNSPIEQKKKDKAN